MRAVVLIAIAMTTHAGWPPCERFCLPCHGAHGDGKGPTARFGAPATSVPAFDGVLSTTEIDQLVDVSGSSQ